jgi:hypothetical protein
MESFSLVCKWLSIHQIQAKGHDWDEAIDELENVYGFRHADLEGDCRSDGLHNRMVNSRYR